MYMSSFYKVRTHNSNKLHAIQNMSNFNKSYCDETKCAHSSGPWTLAFSVDNVTSLSVRLSLDISKLLIKVVPRSIIDVIKTVSCRTI